MHIVRFRRAICVSGLMLLVGVPAFATPVEFAVNTPQSNITIQLCLIGNCSSDTSPVTGLVRAKINPVASPASVVLYDFTFALTQNIDLHNSFGPLGQFNGTGQNIVLFDALPGFAEPPALVAAGAFTAVDIPTSTSGIIAYTSTGIVCTAFMNSTPPRPCNDNIDLSSQPSQNDTYVGTLAVSPARQATMTFTVSDTQPLDPNNPTLGTLTTTGSITAATTVPLRGDANLDGSVNSLDIAEFVRVLINPGAASWQKQFAVDMNDDDAFDPTDASAFADCLIYGNCGN